MDCKSPLYPSTSGAFSTGFNGTGNPCVVYARKKLAAVPIGFHCAFSETAVENTASPEALWSVMKRWTGLRPGAPPSGPEVEDMISYIQRTSADWLWGKRVGFYREGGVGITPPCCGTGDLQVRSIIGQYGKGEQRHWVLRLTFGIWAHS